MKLYLFLIVFFGSVVSAFAQKNNTPNTFVLDAKMLEAAKNRINKNDDALMPAYKQLLKDADKALKITPFTVTVKKDPAPATDIHDYVSIAPYWFPDPTKPDGLPYIRKDGERNPEVDNYPDKNEMSKMANAVENLTLAYYFSNDEKYADKAATLMRVFFLDPKTHMNPNLNYAQAIKGRNDGRGAGLIESRHFVKVVDGIGLIQKSKSWTKEDQSGMEKWFAEMLDWMQTSKNGIDEMNAKNNHGVFYDMQRMSYALLTKNTDLQKEIIENVKQRLDKQQADDGSFPAELERTIGLHYSTFILKAFYSLAFMAEHINVDLWHYVSPSGKSLKKATEFWYPYATNQAVWKWQQIKPYEYDNECIDLLKIVSIKYNDNKYVKNIDKLIDASTAEKHLSNLIVGMDLR
jgi:hypothetical protein